MKKHEFFFIYSQKKDEEASLLQFLDQHSSNKSNTWSGLQEAFNLHLSSTGRSHVSYPSYVHNLASSSYWIQRTLSEQIPDLDFAAGIAFPVPDTKSDAR